MSAVIFFQSLPNPITDERVRVLAQHPKTDCGCTDEELDDLINYDIKYRMGRDNGGEE